MTEDLIRYDILAQEALRSVVKRVLEDVCKHGLPGEHHFYITFDTNAAGVKLSSRLKEQYPEEMTIVLQHQFWDLIVHDEGFEVGLSFNKIAEKIIIPYPAIKAFFDPSVQFGLQFEMIDDDSEVDIFGGAATIKQESAEVMPIKPEKPVVASKDNAPVAMPKRKPKAAAKKSSETDAEKLKDEPKSDAERPTAEILSLDRFRKK